MAHERSALRHGTVPMGTIIAFALNINSIPDGWLLCDGSPIPVQYQELITALGSPSTPDLSGRTLIGTGTPGNGAQSDGTTPNFPAGQTWPVGYTGGEYQHQLTVDELASHEHPLDYQFDLNSGCHSGSGSSPCLTSTTHYATNVGGDQPHNTMQPYYSVNYIIYTGQ